MTETPYFLRKLTTGKDVPITPPMSIGRSEDSALRLVEGKPSRHHAKITSDQSNVFVEDLDSTNGTFVNGRRLDAKVKHKLNAGDQLRFDIEEFEFLAPAPAGDADKTVLRASSPDKTLFRSPRPDPKTAEVAQRTLVEPRLPAGNAAVPTDPVADQVARADSPPARVQRPLEKAEVVAAPAGPAQSIEPVDKRPPGEGPGGAQKDLLGAQAQALPGSFVDDPKRTVQYVKPKKKPGQAPSAAPAPAHAAGDPPYLWIDSGNSVGKKFELKPGSGTKMSWRIGSSEECYVRLDDTGVSSKHAILRHDGSTWRLIDDLSVNGIYVNDDKVLSGYLASGDRIRFGPVECRFYLPPPGAGARASGRARWRKYGLIAAGAFALTLALLYLAFRFTRQ